jgi:hypothetical protein
MQTVLQLDTIGNIFETAGFVIRDGCEVKDQFKPTDVPWYRLLKGRMGAALHKFLEYPPVKCYTNFMGKFGVASSFLDLALTTTWRSMTQVMDDKMQGYERRACILRPASKVDRNAGVRTLQFQQGCTPSSGKRRYIIM